MDIRINQTWARIGHWTENAKQTIEQPKADLSIEQISGRFDIKTELPKVLIDQTECFAEVGLKGPLRLIYDQGQRAQQIALEAIGQIASEGDQMMMSQAGGKVIADISFTKFVPAPFDWNIAFLPQSRPKIEVTGSQNIQFEKGGAKIEAKANAPIIEATTGRVNYEMLQHSSISFEYVGKKLDKVF